MQRTPLTYPDVARLLGTGLISTGLGLLLFVMITVVWGDPFTAVAASGEQNKLQQEQTVVIATDSSALRPTAGADPALTRFAAAKAKRKLRSGQAVGWIRIPKIKLKKVVVKGAEVPDLTKGPGIYNETGLPGSGMPVAIAGHRTTHGAPFLNIDKLKPGDLIVLDTAYARITYRVTRTQIIAPTDWSIINVGAALPSKQARQTALRRYRTTATCLGSTCEHLVLTACHPKYSARQRIAVFSVPVGVQLRGGAA